MSSSVSTSFVSKQTFKPKNNISLFSWIPSVTRDHLISIVTERVSNDHPFLFCCFLHQQIIRVFSKSLHQISSSLFREQKFAFRRFLAPTPETTGTSITDRVSKRSSIYTCFFLHQQILAVFSKSPVFCSGTILFFHLILAPTPETTGSCPTDLVSNDHVFIFAFLH